MMQLIQDIPGKFIATGTVTLFDHDSPEELVVELAEQADVRYVAVVGLQQLAKRARFILGNGARLRCVTVACGSGDDRIAADYVIEHRGRGSTATTLVKGVFGGAARAEVFGLIKIPPSGNQVESFLEQRALLISDRAYANLQPKLQIEANDLKASHAATVGQLDEEQLFYCQSRGIPRDAARLLIVQAFLDEVLREVPDAAQRETIGAALRRKLALA